MTLWIKTREKNKSRPGKNTLWLLINIISRQKIEKIIYLRLTNLKEDNENEEEGKTFWV